MCEGLSPFEGGDPYPLSLGLLVCPPQREVHDGLMDPFPGGGKVAEGFGGQVCPAVP